MPNRRRFAVPLLAMGLAVQAGALWVLAWRSEALRNDAGDLGALAVSAWVVGNAIATAVAFLVASKSSERSLPPARVFFYAAIAATVVLVASDLEPRLTTAAATVSAVFGVHSIAVLTAPWAARHLRAKLLRGADILCMNLCILLVAAEVGLRAVARASHSPLLERMDLDVRRRLETFGLPPGYDYFGFAINSHGFHDTEFVPKGILDDRFLVASIGDSFAVGVVPHAYHFTTLCESIVPGCEVYNIGCPTAGPWDYLYWIETVARWVNADLIVVHLFVGNDVKESERRKETPLDRWMPQRHNCYAWFVPARILSVRRGAENAENAGMPSGIAPGTITAMRGVPLRDPAVVKHTMPWLDDPLLERPTFSDEAFLTIERERARLACGLDASLYDSLFESLDAMAAAAGSVPLAFVLIPDEFQVDDDLWARVAAALPGERLERDRPQREIGQYLDARGIPYVDLLPLLRSVDPFPDRSRHLYHLRDTHFNARGNRVAASGLAQLVRRFREQ